MSTIAKSPVKRRTKGEQTRLQILEAAVKVLARNGIKGTTHRAIANEAQLQLSLTTYYFKDIQELVHEAFILSSSNTIAKAGLAWTQTFELLDSYTKTKLKRVATRQELAATLTNIATNYLISKIKENSVDLAVEQLLFTEIQITPQLRALAATHREALLAPFTKLCGYFNPDLAEVDGDIMLTVFTQLEYRHLTLLTDEIDETYIKLRIERLVNAVLQIKSNQN